MKRVVDAWNRFFFAPTSGLSLGVFRCLFGLIVFLNVLGMYPWRETFLGVDAIVGPDVTTRLFADRWVILGFSFLPVTDPGMACFLIGLMIAALCLSLGLFTRLASIAVFVGIYSLHNRNHFITNAGDLLMRIETLILLFAPSGAAFSLDRLWRVARGKEGPEPRLISPWAWRLLQLQVAYLYLSTALFKLEGPGWRDGTALYYALRYLELKRLDVHYLFYTLWQVKLASWGTLVAEFGMGTLVWFRRFRYAVLAAAFSLHFGINLAMQFPIFQYLMMANLLVFVYPEDLMKWLGPVRKLLDRAGIAKRLRLTIGA